MFYARQEDQPNDIDSVVSKFKEKQDKLSLLHCISNYPLENANTRLGHIKYLKKVGEEKLDI